MGDGSRGGTYAWRILLIPGIRYQEIAIDGAIDRQETALEPLQSDLV